MHAPGYQDAGIYPVKLKAGTLIDAFVMLVLNDANFHFPSIETIQADPALYQLLANGAASDVAARYHSAVENQPLELGALLTIGTAIRDIPLDDRTARWDITGK
jgi:hypothetical protein